jgi:hypothetical protein
MACGVLFLALAVATAALLLYYVLPRRISRLLLRLGALCFLGLMVAILFYALTRRGEADGRHALGFLLLCGLTGLFIWGVARSFRPAPPRRRPATCPPIGLLKAMLAERVRPPMQARLAAHLEVCAACQHRIEGLTAAQSSLPGLARKLSDRPPAPAPALRKVMDRLKESKDEATGAEPVFAGDLPLGFLAPPDKPGQLGRLERYEVLEEVGRGGMGVVLKAFDPSLHRIVAIKVLAPQLATSGVARKRFLREARAAACVAHDHIVTIHAVDQANGLPYLVMQFIAGESLQERIDRDGPIGDLTEVLRIGAQTASALAAAHAHGIVHRDVKPGNILLEEGVQRVKITDFGLARAIDDASLTQSGVVSGSPLYMAPEQARGEALDHRADLFSLGSVLYAMCTGRPPFRAANALAVLRRVCEDVPRPIRETSPEVPDWLAAVVDKLMAKHAGDRFQSAGEVVEVLGRRLAELQHGGWIPPATPAPTPDTAGLPTSITICPSCGASLHVPERMVGGTVHCAECGKPFRVEDTSEEIVVARAVPSPFGRRAAAKKKGRAWVWALGVGVALLPPLLVIAGLTVSGPPPAGPQEAHVAPKSPQPAVPFWRSTLAWFPAEATLFGAINLEPFGPRNLGDEWSRAALRLAVSAEAERKLAPENLGRARIERLSAAYYEGAGPEPSRGIVQLEGVALDGRKRIIDFVREATAGKARVERPDRWRMGGEPIRVSSPELPFALGLFDDHRVFLARTMSTDGKEGQHLKALARLPAFDFANEPRPAKDVLTGDNPPWLQAALREAPADACGLIVGEVPREWRKFLTEALGLRACPRSFAFHMRRRGAGVALSLSLNLDKAGAELILLEDLEKWRREGLDVLQARFPAVREEPEALALLEQALRTVRWRANPGSGCVRTSVQLPGPTWRALGALVKRAR